jgi:hypothetical protein
MSEPAAAASLRPMSTPTRQFIRHYLEMIAAMVAGMVVLGIPAEAALRALGTSSSALERDAPAVAFLGMALIMTIPMVGLMRFRGHAWRPCWEMSASMFLPTFGVIAVLWAGAMHDFGTLMVIEHVAMLPAMLVAMLLRFGEYAGCGHDHAAQTSKKTVSPGPWIRMSNR